MVLMDTVKSTAGEYRENTGRAVQTPVQRERGGVEREREREREREGGREGGGERGRERGGRDRDGGGGGDGRTNRKIQKGTAPFFFFNSQLGTFWKEREWEGGGGREGRCVYKVEESVTIAVCFANFKAFLPPKN